MKAPRGAAVSPQDAIWRGLLGVVGLVRRTETPGPTNRGSETSIATVQIACVI